MKQRLIDTENKLLNTRERRGWGTGEIDEGYSKVQTSGYKMSKSWECNVKHKEYSQ